MCTPTCIGLHVHVGLHIRMVIFLHVRVCPCTQMLHVAPEFKSAIGTEKDKEHLMATHLVTFKVVAPATPHSPMASLYM